MRIYENDPSFKISHVGSLCSALLPHDEHRRSMEPGRRDFSMRVHWNSMAPQALVKAAASRLQVVTLQFNELNRITSFDFEGDGRPMFEMEQGIAGDAMNPWKRGCIDCLLWPQGDELRAWGDFNPKAIARLELPWSHMSSSQPMIVFRHQEVVVDFMELFARLWLFPSLTYLDPLDAERVLAQGVCECICFQLPLAEDTADWQWRNFEKSLRRSATALVLVEVGAQERRETKQRHLDTWARRISTSVPAESTVLCSDVLGMGPSSRGRILALMTRA